MPKTDSRREREIEAARKIAEQAKAELDAIGLPQDVAPLGRPTAHQIEEAERYRDPEQISAYRAWQNETGLSSPERYGPAARRRAARALEQVERKLDAKKRNLRHAGDPVTRRRAERNIATLEAQVERLEAEIDVSNGSSTWDEIASARWCKNPECQRELPRPREWPSAWCAKCLQP